MGCFFARWSHPCPFVTGCWSEEEFRLHQRKLHRQLQAEQRIHRNPGTVRIDLRIILEDGLGTERLRHRHDYKPDGKVEGKQSLTARFFVNLFSLIHALANYAIYFLEVWNLFTKVYT